MFEWTFVNTMQDEYSILKNVTVIDVSKMLAFKGEDPAKRGN